MRRLDVHPFRRLRNPGRHLRALARWPELIVSQLPEAHAIGGDAFLNFKIPVYSKVSDPPHATPETQRACLAALFAAADAVERSDRRLAGCRVAVLATTPFLFDSEVTLFFDESHFRSFLPPATVARTHWEGGWVEAGPASPGEVAEMVPETPDGLEAFGGTWMRQFDNERGVEHRPRVNWVWAFPRR